MSDQLKLVTFNVRCTWDWLDGFVSRMGLIFDKIKKEAPDVVAFQEVTPQILEGLKHIMPDYLFAGHGREADYSGEGLYTAINLNTLQLVGLETFWIAPDPYDKHSKFSDQSPFPRICVETTLFHPASKTEFRVYNVHLDHEGTLAMADGLRCVLQKARERNNNYFMETVFLGDFNQEPGGPVEQAFSEWESPKLFDITSALPGTFHDYGKLERPLKIDYILTTQGFKNCLTDTTLWTETLNGHKLSDHYPICAELRL